MSFWIYRAASHLSCLRNIFLTRDTSWASCCREWPLFGNFLNFFHCYWSVRFSLLEPVLIPGFPVPRGRYRPPSLLLCWMLWNSFKVKSKGVPKSEVIKMYFKGLCFIDYRQGSRRRELRPARWAHGSGAGPMPHAQCHSPLAGRPASDPAPAQAQNSHTYFHTQSLKEMLYNIFSMLAFWRGHFMRLDLGLSICGTMSGLKKFWCISDFKLRIFSMYLHITHAHLLYILNHF